jgi:uroporphyrinogen III methyltransferase / synthase
LMRGGKPATTPVAIVRRCSWPDREVIRCSLEAVGDVVVTRNIRPPVVFLVGEVVDLASEGQQ